MLGQLLKGIRAGENRLVWNHAAARHAPVNMKIHSPAFAAGADIPLKYAGPGVGQNISPPLCWSGVPLGALELVLVMEDPDAPLPWPFVHLVAFGLHPGLSQLAEGALDRHREAGLRYGRGSFGRVGYSGPRALAGHGRHRYFFTLLALNMGLGNFEQPTAAALMYAVEGRVVGRAQLVGCFERQ